MNLSKYTKPKLDEWRLLLNLTDEEEIVFTMLARRKSRIEIAETLKTSLATVDRRIRCIRNKMEFVPKEDDLEMEKCSVPIWQKVCITVEEAAEYSNIGINKIDELAKSPNCPFVLYVGRKKLIKRKEFDEYISANIEI